MEVGKITIKIEVKKHNNGECWASVNLGRQHFAGRGDDEWSAIENLAQFIQKRPFEHSKRNVKADDEHASSKSKFFDTATGCALFAPKTIEELPALCLFCPGHKDGLCRFDRTKQKKVSK